MELTQLRFSHQPIFMTRKLRFIMRKHGVQSIIAIFHFKESLSASRKRISKYLKSWIKKMLICLI
ncbi:hypothetical protein SAMN06265795_10230 [Noviherbaspirillum humi]|uniref:Uncharacterized protein n=1 Tax=Noviherbaspirillum humi TaxID=1688639 RepID=A0A239D625_9BURK|nr:hypothetical protein SAMN06265795_10230 [Noviherbaspirillum humi]